LQILGFFLQKMGKKLSTFVGDSTYTRASATHRGPLRSNKSSLLSHICQESRCEPPLHFGENCDTNVILWHYKEHYEPIQLLSV
jgi:hypothetical protein